MNTGVLPAGIAMFAMMFGAGNVVFPLALGRDVGNNVWFALAGFCLTAVLVPLLGIVSLSLFQGDYKKFLGTMGRVPGALVALICMVLIGPFGCIPRCITISYAAVQWYFPEVTLAAFSIIAALLVFCMTFYKSGVIDILGRFLGPIKFVLLFMIMLCGLIGGSCMFTTSITPYDAFMQGFFEGYGTMDLLGAIFFAGLICKALRGTPDEHIPQSVVIIRSLKAGVIGGLLLGIVYTGFCLVAAFNAIHVQGADKAQLLTALATLVLGSYGGMLANFTVAISCLTTAIALTTVFADYVRKELTGGRLAYPVALAITTIITCVMTNLGFSGIMAVINPVIVVCYPALIVLAIVNIAHKLFGFRYTRMPVLIVLFSMLCLHIR